MGGCNISPTVRKIAAAYNKFWYVGDFQKLNLGLYAPTYKGPTRKEYGLN